MDKDKLKNYFWKNGYVILRNIYSDEQIHRYRKFIKKNIEEIVGQGQKNWKDLEIKENKDVLSYPELRDSILNKKLLDAIKSIFDDENFYYWGYSSFRYNEKSYRSTHNDAKNDKENPFKTASRLDISLYHLVKCLNLARPISCHSCLAIQGKVEISAIVYSLHDKNLVVANLSSNS